jgi:hypothetical protein
VLFRSEGPNEKASKRAQETKRLIKRNRDLMNEVAKQKEAHQGQADAEGAEKDLIKQLEDKILDLQSRNRALTQGITECRAQVSQAEKSELAYSRRAQEADEKCHSLEEQIQMLTEQNKRLSGQKAEDASNVVKRLQSVSAVKGKMAAYKKRAEEEMRKRVSAEEVVIAQKEEVFGLKKENALLKDQVADSRSADVEPLVALLRDLRLECIEMEDEFRLLMEQIRPAKPILTEEVPKGICESVAAVVSRLIAQASQIEIENRELRVLLQRFMRAASTYHKIVEVVQQYPILSTDDIGQNEPYGNWVLGVDVEHLQRTVIKLHEILAKKR